MVGVVAPGPAAAGPSADRGNHSPTITFQAPSISGFSATIGYTLNRAPYQIAGLACSLAPSGGVTSTASCGVVTSSSKESTTRRVTLPTLTPGDYSYTVSARLTDGNRVGSLTNFTVVPVPAECTVTGYSLTYDGTAHTATGTCTGLDGVNLTAGLDLSGTTHTDAGTYDRDAWSFSDPAGNYTNSGGTLFDVIRQATAG
jgi:hypothetical protein